MASSNFSADRLLDCLSDSKNFSAKYREFKSAYLEQQQ